MSVDREEVERSDKERVVGLWREREKRANHTISETKKALLT